MIALRPIPKPDSCKACVGWSWGSVGFMPEPEGPTHAWNGVLLVGEALGEQEAEVGKPFVGKAGLALSQMLQRGGYRREHFAIDNAVRCRPPDNKLVGQAYERQAVNSCAVHLDGTIARIRPRVIVTLGDLPLRRVLGIDSFGAGETLTKRRGFPEWSNRYGCWVVPTFHPSYIMRGNRHLTQVFLADIGKAVGIARDGFKPFNAALLSDPSTDTCERFVQGAEQLVRLGVPISLAYDIETPYKSDELEEDDLEVDDPTFTILRVGFCYGPDQALSVAWLPQYIPFIQRLLNLPCRKLTWNGRYDTPRLLANGMAIGGVEWDLMWAWHIRRSDLPKGLAFVASMLLPDQLRWKHLASTEAGRYNALDALITWRLEGPILSQLDQTDLRTVFERHIVALDEVLLAMSKRGVKVDYDWRLSLARDIDSELAHLTSGAVAVVPREARRAKIFSGKPKTTDGLITEIHEKQVRVCPACGLVNPKKPHFKVYAKKVNACGGLSPVVEQREVETWVRLEPWAPSNKQMLAYANAKGHRTVTDRKTKNPTFNEEALKTLTRWYPEDQLYAKIIDIRELETLAARYAGWVEHGPDGVRLVGGIPVGPDGRAHTTFLHNPSTLRLSSQAPNLQNIPRTAGASPLTKRVKGMFVADPGHLLFELDYKAIEAQIVGYCARSLRYIRMSKLGVHDYLNGHILHRAGKIESAPDASWSDKDLKAIFKDLKARFPAERDVAKRIVHGGNYGMTPRRMWELYPKDFPTVKDAASLQNLYFDVFPEIKKWQNDTIEKADNGASLRNAFGYVHHFFHVKEWFKFDGKWEWKWGEDAKRALAFDPQSTAAAIIKEAILRLHSRDLSEFLLLQVHDSLLGTDFRERVLETVRKVAAIMTEPNPFLPMEPLGETGFLSIEVEAKVGERWSEMEEVAV